MFLKQLTGDRQIFRDLPAKVQRQVSCVWDVGGSVWDVGVQCVGDGGG